MPELVTIATYRYPAKAEAAQWALGEEGIEAFVMDKYIVAADWFLGNAIGYVKLQVRSFDVAAATAVLQANPRLLDRGRAKRAPDEADDDSCLNCGSKLDDNDDACPICGWTYAE